MDLTTSLRAMRTASHSEDVEWLREVATERLIELAAGPTRSLDRASLRYLHELLRISGHYVWPVERDIPFVVVILHALAKVGGKQSLRAVDPLTTCDCLPVRAAAVQCAAAIRNRVPSEGSEQLLRVAEPVDLLLRRAAEGSSSLLRPPEEEA